MKPTAGKDRMPDDRSVIVQDRAQATLLGEQRIAAVAEQVLVESLVGLLLAVAINHIGDRLRRAGTCLAVRTPPTAC